MSDLYGDAIVEEVEENYKIKKKSSAFFFNAICDKRDVIEENPDLEREYVPFVVNKYFSWHQDCVSDANDMNARFKAICNGLGIAEPVFDYRRM